MDESQRQAAAIKASISTYVATATLAVLAGALALFTWISQTFLPPWTFYMCMAVAIVLLVVSTVVGGLGQDWLVNEVAHDRWTNQATWQFNVQTILTLFALFFVIAATVIGATSSTITTETDKQLRALERNVATGDVALASDKTLRSELTTLQAELAQLAGRFQAAESEDHRSRWSAFGGWEDRDHP